MAVLAWNERSACTTRIHGPPTASRPALSTSASRCSLDAPSRPHQCVDERERTVRAEHRDRPRRVVPEADELSLFPYVAGCIRTGDDASLVRREANVECRLVHLLRFYHSLAQKVDPKRGEPGATAAATAPRGPQRLTAHLDSAFA